MNLNDLKPAWKQFLLCNSMQPADQNEILLIIERADHRKLRRLPSILTSTLVFIVLTICCQGG